MTDADSVSAERWHQFEAAFARLVELQHELESERDKRALIRDFLNDGEYGDALASATGAVRRADARPVAYEIAELMLPEIDLMLRTVGDDRFAEIEPEYLDRTLAMYRGRARRLQSVVDAHAAGIAVSTAFRDELECWWDELKAAGDLDSAIAALAERLGFEPHASPDADQQRIAAVLIDWLYSNDQWRWQPALVLLRGARVRQAAPEMRDAALFAYDETKKPFVDTFRRYAAELEHASRRSSAP